MRAHSQVNRPQNRNNAAVAQNLATPEQPITNVNLTSIGDASSAVNNVLGMVTANNLAKPTSKDRRLSVDELIKERLKFQPELLNAYPDMPVINAG